MAINITSVCSAVLTGINLRFKFQEKNLEIKQLIEKLNEIQVRLEFINSSNGNLMAVEYLQFLRNLIQFYNGLNLL